MGYPRHDLGALSDIASGTRDNSHSDPSASHTRQRRPNAHAGQPDIHATEGWCDPSPTIPCPATVAPPTDFADYLHRTGRITTHQLRAVRTVRAENWVPIGLLALRRRALSARQVRAILHAQADRPDLRFGEMACLLDYLPCDQVRDLLLEQKKSGTSTEEAVLKLALMTAEEISEAREEFRRLAGPA
ncbi:MAG: hypothetical protein AB8I08_11310 [Sandaracinaceae bacterium]